MSSLVVSKEEPRIAFIKSFSRRRPMAICLFRPNAAATANPNGGVLADVTESDYDHVRDYVYEDRSGGFKTRPLSSPHIALCLRQLGTLTMGRTIFSVIESVPPLERGRLRISS